MSCILSSHLPSHVTVRTSLGSLSSTSTLPPSKMAFNITSDGSPTPRKGPARFNMPSGGLNVDNSPEVLGQVNDNSQNYFPCGLHPFFGSSLTSNLQGLKRPLGTSIVGNIGMPPMQQQQPHFGGFKVSSRPVRSHSSPLLVSFHFTWAKLTNIQNKGDNYQDKAIMDSLRQRLNERSSPDDPYKSSSSGSVPITPATEDYASTPPTMVSSANSSVLVNASELKKIKEELQAAKDEIARINQDAHSHLVARSTMDHLSQSSDADYSYNVGEVTEQTLAQLQNSFNASVRIQDGWSNESVRPPYNTSNSFGAQYPGQAQAAARAPIPVGQPTARRSHSFLNEPTHFPLDQGFRAGGMNNGMGGFMGNGMAASFNAGYGNGMSNPPSRPDSAFDPAYNQYRGPSMQATKYPTPIGTLGGSRLSPVAKEFDVASGMGPSPWNSQVLYHPHRLACPLMTLTGP